MVLLIQTPISIQPEMEFKEFKPRFKSAKTRFKLSAGLNLETFDTIFKWNQPYLNRGLNLNRRSNSLNSATDGFADPDYYEKFDRFLRLGDWVDFKGSQPLGL